MRDRLLRRERRDREDAPAGAPLEVGEAEPDEPHGGLEHELERLLERLGRDVARRPGGRAARVPDEDVDPAERLQGGLHDPLEVARHRDVAANGEATDPLRLALEQVATAADEGDVRAFGGECLCARETEPRRGSGDNGGAALEPEVHERPRVPVVGESRA